MANEAARARAGATLLDSETPGWAEGIDPDRLSLGSCEDCVFGQTFGSYDTGLAELGLTREQAQAYGFLTEHFAEDWFGMLRATRDALHEKIDVEYRLLRSAWLVEIALRLGTPESEDPAIVTEMVNSKGA